MSSQEKLTLKGLAQLRHNSMEHELKLPKQSSGRPRAPATLVEASRRHYS